MEPSLIEVEEALGEASEGPNNTIARGEEGPEGAVVEEPGQRMVPCNPNDCPTPNLQRSQHHLDRHLTISAVAASLEAQLETPQQLRVRPWRMEKGTSETSRPKSASYAPRPSSTILSLLAITEHATSAP